MASTTLDFSSPAVHAAESRKDRKETCNQCRERKVRCDGRLPSCHNCQRLGFVCTSQSQADRRTSTSQTIEGVISRPQKLRGSKACLECRLQKTRCSGASPCSNCQRRGLKCAYPQLKRSFRQVSSAMSSSSAQIDPPAESTAESNNPPDSVVPPSSRPLPRR